MNGIVGLVTARGGSKGIPGKNVKPMAGKPMMAWTIEAARRSGALRQVLLSTDSAEIAEVGRQWGAEVPFLRPAKLAQDDTPHSEVVAHALDWLDAHGGLPEYLVLLQPTSPLRTAADIAAAAALARGRGAEAVVGVSEVDHHPFLAKRVEEGGVLKAFGETPGGYLRRQDLPPAFAINGAVYVNRCENFRRRREFVPSGALAYVMPPERSLDVDTPLDFFLAEQLLLSHGKF